MGQTADEGLIGFEFTQTRMRKNLWLVSAAQSDAVKSRQCTKGFEKAPGESFDHTHTHTRSEVTCDMAGVSLLFSELHIGHKH